MKYYNMTHCMQIFYCYNITIIILHDGSYKPGFVETHGKVPEGPGKR